MWIYTESRGDLFLQKKRSVYIKIYEGEYVINYEYLKKSFISGKILFE